MKKETEKVVVTLRGSLDTPFDIVKEVLDDKFHAFMEDNLLSGKFRLMNKKYDMGINQVYEPINKFKHVLFKRPRRAIGYVHKGTYEVCFLNEKDNPYKKRAKEGGVVVIHG